METRFLLLPAILFLLVPGFRVGGLQAHAALVYTEPAVLELGAGQVETLQIRLADADKVYGIDLRAAFDPSVVEVVDADRGKTGIQVLPGEFPRPDYVVRNLADNTAGTLMYVVTQLNPTPPSSGKGVVLTMQLRGKAAGGRCILTFTSVILADRSGVKQAVRTQAAELVVVSPKSPTATAMASPDITLVKPTLARTATMKSTPIGKASPTVAGGTPVEAAESAPASSDRLITTLTIGGFSIAVVFTGLAIWLLASKRRK